MMQREQLLLRAPAKVNLYLKVIGRRADGYHLLDTLMQKVGLYDEIEVQACAEGIHLHCVNGTLPENRDNIVYRAAELFLRETQGRRKGDASGVRVSLTKRIPVAAGLGGGSSDAAATLNGLNELYQCGCSGAELAAMGLRLGADVPFFLATAPAAIATGIGEQLHPVPPLKGCSLVLVNPGIPVSTRWVYQNFALTVDKIGSNLKNSQEDIDRSSTPREPLLPESWAARSCNDLERVTIARHPQIEQIKAGLVESGAVGALMSGSGPTVFGVFSNRQQAEVGFIRFKSRFVCTYLVDPVEEE